MSIDAFKKRGVIFGQPITNNFGDNFFSSLLIGQYERVKKIMLVRLIEDKGRADTIRFDFNWTSLEVWDWSSKLIGHWAK